MVLALGTRLGVYEVIAPIGEGGMGQVFRARDTKLDRDVAIKILPEAFAHDADRLARFQREAKTLASLNHPNIAAIYGLEESGGLTALVMELVEGDDLSQRIVRGEIPIDEALAIAKQMAEALEAAHEQGIIHRDLKPANIKVRGDGTVKVLDFGLAKAMEPTGATAASNSMSPTITSPAMMTGVGMILGTAAYMSPEQASGKPVDRRSDLWAFGVVLFELLTGRRLFEGETVSHVLAAVLKSEPNWSLLPADTPVAIRRLLARCLHKDGKRRLDSAAAARLEIDEALASPGPESAASVSAAMPGSRSVVPVVAAVLVTAVLAIAGALALRPSAAVARVVRFSFALPAGQQFTNTTRRLVAVSPDGTQLVYVANNRLYIRALADLEAHTIAGSEAYGVEAPVFSPDGQWIAFYPTGEPRIKRIPVGGGVAQPICEVAAPNGLSWDTSGLLVGQGAKGIVRCAPFGGRPEQLITVADDELADGPQMLPGGKTVLFTVAKATDGLGRWDKGKISVQTLGSKERKTLIDGASDARYVSTGHLVYAVGGTLFAVAFDPVRLETRGGSVPAVAGVRRVQARDAPGTAHFAVSEDGTLLYVPGPVGPLTGARSLVMHDRNGAITPLAVPAGPYVRPRISRDGKRLAIGSDDGKEAVVWTYGLAGTSARQRLTFGGRNRFPVWSPDATRLAFQSDRDGDAAIFSQRADGSGAPERLTNAGKGETHVPESWSPDGRMLLFTVQKGDTYSLWTVSIADRKASSFGNVQSLQPVEAVFSPDGRWVAYATADVAGGEATPNRGVYVQPFPATGARYQMTKDRLDFHPAWAPTGEELFYVPAAGRFAAVRVATRPAVSFSPPTTLPSLLTLGSLSDSPRDYDVLPDGRFIGLMNGTTLDPSLAIPQVRVVLNWTEELKRLVPTK